MEVSICYLLLIVVAFRNGNAGNATVPMWIAPRGDLSFSAFNPKTMLGWLENFTVFTENWQVVQPYTSISSYSSTPLSILVTDAGVIVPSIGSVLSESTGLPYLAVTGSRMSVTEQERNVPFVGVSNLLFVDCLETWDMATWKTKWSIDLCRYAIHCAASQKRREQLVAFTGCNRSYSTEFIAQSYDQVTGQKQWEVDISKELYEKYKMKPVERYVNGIFLHEASGILVIVFSESFSYPNWLVTLDIFTQRVTMLGKLSNYYKKAVIWENLVVLFDGNRDRTVMVLDTDPRTPTFESWILPEYCYTEEAAVDGDSLYLITSCGSTFGNKRSNLYVLNKKGKVIRSATGDGKYFAPMALTGDLMIARTNYKSLAAFNKETGNAIASWTPPSDCEISGIALRGEQIFVSCWNSKQKTVIITALTLSINVDLILAITFGCLGFLILMTGCVWCYCRIRKRKTETTQSSGATTSNNSGVTLVSSSINATAPRMEAYYRPTSARSADHRGLDDPPPAYQFSKPPDVAPRPSGQGHINNQPTDSLEQPPSYEMAVRG